MVVMTLRRTWLLWHWDGHGCYDT